VSKALDEVEKDLRERYQLALRVKKDLGTLCNGMGGGSIPPLTWSHASWLLHEVSEYVEDVEDVRSKLLRIMQERIPE
jgi:hypothetical protein